MSRAIQARANGATQARVIYFTAYFTHCSWAAQPPLTLDLSGTVGLSGGTGGPVSTTGTVAPPPHGTAGPTGGTNSSPPGRLM